MNGGIVGYGVWYLLLLRPFILEVNVLTPGLRERWNNTERTRPPPLNGGKDSSTRSGLGGEPCEECRLSLRNMEWLEEG